VRLAQRALASALRPLTAARERVPGTIACVETREPVVALTFDDGPHPEFTPRLLDILDQHRARGTFFLVGEMADKHPDLVRRLASAGHSIGNHSWDHPFFPSLGRRSRWTQIRACERALAPHGGARLFRPPYGAQSMAMRLDALCLGYKIITWSVEAKDWRDHDPERMAQRLIDTVKPGAIVLLHDAIYRSRQAVPLYDRAPMLRALSLFLEQIRGRFRFVTVPELLRYGRSLCQAS
jgi:peptidoglycan-N-acetylglucosamine deacetylase